MTYFKLITMSEELFIRLNFKLKHEDIAYLSSPELINCISRKTALINAYLTNDEGHHISHEKRKRMFTEIPSCKIK